MKVYKKMCGFNSLEFSIHIKQHSGQTMARHQTMKKSKFENIQSPLRTNPTKNERINAIYIVQFHLLSASLIFLILLLKDFLSSRVEAKKRIKVLRD